MALFSMGLGLAGMVYLAWYKHQAGRAGPVAPIVQKSGLRGAFAFPILVGHEFFGVIEFLSDSILAPDQELLNTFSTIGNQVGQYISRRRSEERAQEQEDLSRQAAKMESVGRLAAGIAHEINPPIQYVGDNIRFLEDAFGDLGKVIEGYAWYRKGMNGSAKGGGKGTGQGLALSRAIIVGKHGGAITYQTEVGKGTTFVVRLPLSIQPEPVGA